MSHATSGDQFDAVDLSPVRLDPTRAGMAAAVCEVAQLFAHRGWMLGGGGHVSVALRRGDPMRLLITPDGIDKATVEPDDCVILEGDQIEQAWPEAKLHALLVQHAEAGSVVHSQSPASLALSEGMHHQGGLMLEGYDLLRQFADGKQTVDRHWVPIIEHTPNSPAPGRQLIAQITDERQPARFGLLVRRCGLIAWGKDLEQARRHAELFETLFATIISRYALNQPRR